MLLKVTFAVLLLVVAATAATVDDNDIVDLALDNYFGIVNASGTFCSCMLTCWVHYNFLASKVERLAVAR